MYKLGVIGIGHMGGAVIRGAVSCGVVKKEELLLFDLSEKLINEFSDEGYIIADGYEKLRNDCDFLMLAIPPQAFDTLMPQLAEYNPSHNQLIISIAAGIDFKYIKNHLGSETEVVCIMPNTPLLIGIGATAMAASDGVSEDKVSVVEKLFSSMGIVKRVDGEQLFAVVPANGSTPAYVYYFIESIARAVAARGVEYETALQLTAQSFKGSAELLLNSDKSAQQLIDGICTPGGLTAQTIEHFNKVDLPEIIKQGCDACIDRGLEIRGERG